MNAEIRMVWMWGNVALHQDPKKDKDKPRDGSAERKGQDASGEALYLDNRGTNKAISYVYQRDPTEKIYLPGPLPPARVENDDMKISAAGMIQMNQETDQAWVYGPGTLTQLAARGFLTDKSSSEPLPMTSRPTIRGMATPLHDPDRRTRRSRHARLRSWLKTTSRTNRRRPTTRNPRSPSRRPVPGFRLPKRCQ